jgi:hypothetical protein
MGKVNLSAVLIILAISIPATVSLVAMGIEPTTAPSVPQVADELIEEQITSEAPADDAPPVEPEAVDLESPDPVTPVEEVKAEDPVPEPEEPVTRGPGDAVITLVGDIFRVSFPPRRRSDSIDYTISLKATSGPDIILAQVSRGITRAEDTAGIVDIPVPPPEGDYDVDIDGNMAYTVDVNVHDGEDFTGTATFFIPAPLAPQDIEVTMITVSPYDPPIVIITNVGETPLLITAISVDSTYYDINASIVPGMNVTLADLGVVLPADVGMHSILITSDDPDEPNVALAYSILAPPEPTLTVVAADFAAGIGSERFGVNVTCDPAGKDVIVNVVLEAMSDGDDISPVESIAITEVTSVKIIVKTLFEDESGDDAEPGVLYQYRVWLTVDGDDENATIIDNVGLWHWSTFTRLRSKNGAWEAKVAWDAIQVDSMAGFSVYVALRKWDGEKLWDVTDSNGTQVVVSQTVEGIAAGAATLLLDKPDQKVVGDEVVGGETWMAGLRSGYYFFTYMAENDAVDPWAERIGCPPEAL